MTESNSQKGIGCRKQKNDLATCSDVVVDESTLLDRAKMVEMATVAFRAHEYSLDDIEFDQKEHHDSNREDQSSKGGERRDGLVDKLVEMGFIKVSMVMTTTDAT